MALTDDFDLADFELTPAAHRALDAAAAARAVCSRDRVSPAAETPPELQNPPTQSPLATPPVYDPPPPDSASLRSQPEGSLRAAPSGGTPANVPITNRTKSDACGSAIHPGAGNDTQDVDRKPSPEEQAVEREFYERESAFAARPKRKPRNTHTPQLPGLGN